MVVDRRQDCSNGDKNYIEFEDCNEKRDRKVSNGNRSQDKKKSTGGLRSG